MNLVSCYVCSLTTSPVDHAALIIKLLAEPEEIYFVEATGNNGVFLNCWSLMKSNIGKFYDKVALRHLNFERTEKNLKIMEQFVRETLGNTYEFKLSQLMPRETVYKKPSGNNNSNK